MDEKCEKCENCEYFTIDSDYRSLGDCEKMPFYKNLRGEMVQNPVPINYCCEKFLINTDKE